MLYTVRRQLIHVCPLFIYLFIYLFTLRCVNPQIQEEMEQYRVKGLQQEHDHRSLLRDIDEQQKETEFQVQDYENQASIISKILDEIKTGLGTVYFTGR